MQPTRRDFLRLASIFALSGSLPLLQACNDRFASDPNAPIRIGYLPITDSTPLLVAIDQKLFEKRGLIVEKPILFRSWAQLVEAFISGQVNVIHLLSPMAIWVRYGSTAPAKVVMWNHMAGSALTVIPNINSIAELGGQTIAIPFWYSIHNIIVQHMIREANLSITTKKPKHAKEVQLIVMAPSDMVAALAAKTIAGYIVAEPFNAIAEQKGIGKILRFSADVWKDHACCVTLMHEHDINNRPEWSSQIVDALVEAQIWSNQNRQMVAHLLSKDGEHKFMPHEAYVLQEILAPTTKSMEHYINTGVIKHPEWEQNRIDFQPFPYPSYTETLLTLLKQTHIAGVNSFLHQLDPKFVAQDLVTDTFVRNALIQQNAFDHFHLPKSLTRQEIIAV